MHIYFYLSSDIILLMLVGILQQQIIQEIQGKIQQQYLRDQLQRMK